MSTIVNDISLSNTRVNENDDIYCYKR